MGKLFDDLMEGLESVEAYMKVDLTEMKVHVPAEIDKHKNLKAVEIIQANLTNPSVD